MPTATRRPLLGRIASPMSARSSPATPKGGKQSNRKLAATPKTSSRGKKVARTTGSKKNHSAHPLPSPIATGMEPGAESVVFEQLWPGLVLFDKHHERVASVAPPEPATKQHAQTDPIAPSEPATKVQSEPKKKTSVEPVATPPTIMKIYTPNIYPSPPVASAPPATMPAASTAVANAWAAPLQTEPKGHVAVAAEPPAAADTDTTRDIQARMASVRNARFALERNEIAKHNAAAKNKAVLSGSLHDLRRCSLCTFWHFSLCQVCPRCDESQLEVSATIPHLPSATKPHVPSEVTTVADNVYGALRGRLYLR